MGEPSSSEKGPFALLRGSVAYFKLREWSLVFTVADNNNNAKRERERERRAFFSRLYRPVDEKGEGQLLLYLR